MTTTSLGPDSSAVDSLEAESLTVASLDVDALAVNALEADALDGEAPALDSPAVDFPDVDSFDVDSLEVADSETCACALVIATVASAVTLTIDRAQAFARRPAILDRIIKVPPRWFFHGPSGHVRLCPAREVAIRMPRA